MTITTLLLYLIILLTSVALYYIRKRLNYWKDRGINHTTPHPLTGNFNGLHTQRNIGDCIREQYEKFKGTGPFCGFYFFQRPAVLVLDEDLVKEILIKDFSNFTNRGLFHNEIDDPLTGHLFLLDGQKWKSLRQKLSPAFSSGKMKFMYPTILQVAEQFVEVFEEFRQKDNVVEIKELLARFTTDIIGRCAFGINCNSLKDPQSQFRLMGKRSLTERRHGKLLTRFMQGFPRLARLFRMRMYSDEITDFFVGIVKETVNYREKNNVQANDFLNILIELKNGNQETKGIKLSIEEMAAQTFVFFVGSFETSSSTMAFALYELALQQDIQNKMREEINKAFDSKGFISYEALQNLQYTGQVISETLRKYPIIPHLNRMAENEYVVPGHPKFVIEKGMPVLIPVLGIHHNPDLYPQPEKFDPERFNSANSKDIDSIQFLAFGNGPRNCIGMRFGQMQTRVGLVFLLRNFKFSVCNKTEIPLEMDKRSFPLTSKNGIFLKLEKL